MKAPPAGGGDAEAWLAAEVAKAGLTGDRFGAIYAGILRTGREVRDAAAAVLAGVERVEAAVAAAAKERPALPVEELRKLGGALAAEAALATARLRRWAAAAALTGAFLAGAAVVGAAWWASPVRTEVGPLTAEAAAFLRQNDLGALLARARAEPVGGGEAKTIRGWTKPPRP